MDARMTRRPARSPAMRVSTRAAATTRSTGTTIPAAVPLLGGNDPTYGDDGDRGRRGDPHRAKVIGGAGRDLDCGDDVSLTRAESARDVAQPRFQLGESDQIVSNVQANAGQALN